MKTSSRRVAVLFGALVQMGMQANGQFGCRNIDNSVVIVPHVVVGSTRVQDGRGGEVNLDFTTTVTIVNSFQDPVSVAVRIRGGTPGLGAPNEEVTSIPSHGTRVLEYALPKDQALDIGWLRVQSDQPVSVVAHIQGRTPEGWILSHISVPGVREGSKFVLPVFRDDPLADNTGIAMVAQHGGVILAELRDLQGNLIAKRELLAAVHCGGVEIHPTPPTCFPPWDFDTRTALLLQEVFPELPMDFRRGMLTIEHLTQLGETEVFTGPQNPFSRKWGQ